MTDKMYEHLYPLLPSLNELITQFMDSGIQFNGFRTETIAKSRNTGDIASFAFQVCVMSEDLYKAVEKVLSSAPKSNDPNNDKEDDGN